MTAVTKLAGFVTAVIAVDYNESPGVLEGVPPARLAARAKAGALVDPLLRQGRVRVLAIWSAPTRRCRSRASTRAPAFALLRQRRVRVVAMGNDLYPTAARAEQFG